MAAAKVGSNGPWRHRARAGGQRPAGGAGAERGRGQGGSHPQPEPAPVGLAQHARDNQSPPSPPLYGQSQGQVETPAQVRPSHKSQPAPATTPIASTAPPSSDLIEVVDCVVTHRRSSHPSQPRPTSPLDRVDSQSTVHLPPACHNDESSPGRSDQDRGRRRWIGECLNELVRRGRPGTARPKTNHEFSETTRLIG